MLSVVSDNLRTIPSGLDMSQAAFADSVGISIGYINMVVNGKRSSISLRLALLIEEKYGYSADWILHNEGDKRAYPFINKGEYNEMKDLINQLLFDELTCLYEFILILEKNEKDKKSNKI
jgi:transcriptional regulator with XRE-family HTH domain